MAATSHARGCPVALCPIDYSLTPFFCVVKRRLKKVAASQVRGEAVVAWVGWVPTKSWMSRRVKEVETVSVTPAQYSPGLKRKNKLIQARSKISFPLCKIPWVMESMQWKLETGRGSTRPGGVFFFLGRQLSSQAKIDGAHGVESWVWCPHGHKDLSCGADVLFHASFVDRLVVGCKDACADLVSKDL